MKKIISCVLALIFLFDMAPKLRANPKEEAELMKMKGKLFIVSVEEYRSNKSFKTGTFGLCEKPWKFGAKFDEEGKIIEWADFNDEEVYLSGYRLNKKDNQIVTEFLGKELENEGREVLMLSKKGFPEKRSMLDPKGKLAEEYVLECDEKGNIVKETQVFPKDDAAITITCKYDEKGRLLEKKIDGLRGFAAQIKPSKTTYEYDKEGRLEREQQWMEKTLTYDKKISHSDNGHVIHYDMWGHDGDRMTEHQEEYDAKGNIFLETPLKDGKPVETYEYEYEFDDQGNWIKQNCFIMEDNKKESRQLYTVRKRKIDYKE